MRENIMPLALTLCYMTNYNGWGFDEDEHPELAKTDLEGKLADMSHCLCDDDGEFDYHEFSEKYTAHINALVYEAVGHNDVNVTIEYDRFSS